MSFPAPLNRLTETVTPPASIAESAKAVAFWLAVGIPVLYIPLLWSGLTSTQLSIFMALVLINVIALYIGHDYKQ